MWCTRTSVWVWLIAIVCCTASGADELAQRLDKAVTRASGGKFWGVVLVARKGKTLFAKGYGFADYKQRPNSPQTMFEIASTSKQFTAAAILKLRMQGKLKLTDKLGKFFKNVPQDKQTITLRQLLGHTSGISAKIGLPYASPKTKEQLAAFVFSKPLVSQPGQKWAYCNVAYALLAAVVEIASGSSFEAYSKTQLFEPASMTDTGFIGDKTLDVKRMSSRKTKYKRPDWTAANWLWGWGYRGMGGVVTTAPDLLKWDQALRGKKILDRAALADFYKPGLRNYALGWFAKTTARGTKRVSHGGGVMGYRCGYARFLDEDTVIVILSNDSCNTWKLEKALTSELFKK